MNPNDLIKKMIAAFQTGDYLCALHCGLKLGDQLLSLFHPDCHPVMRASDIGEEVPQDDAALLAKIAAVQCPDTFPVAGVMRADADVAANPWISILTPLVMALIQRLLDRLNK